MPMMKSRYSKILVMLTVIMVLVTMMPSNFVKAETAPDSSKASITMEKNQIADDKETSGNSNQNGSATVSQESQTQGVIELKVETGGGYLEYSSDTIKKTRISSKDGTVKVMSKIGDKLKVDVYSDDGYMISDLSSYVGDNSRNRISDEFNGHSNYTYEVEFGKEDVGIFCSFRELEEKKDVAKEAKNVITGFVTLEDTEYKTPDTDIENVLKELPSITAVNLQGSAATVDIPITWSLKDDSKKNLGIYKYEVVVGEYTLGDSVKLPVYTIITGASEMTSSMLMEPYTDKKDSVYLSQWLNFTKGGQKLDSKYWRSRGIDYYDWMGGPGAQKTNLVSANYNDGYQMNKLKYYGWSRGRTWSQNGEVDYSKSESKGVNCTGLVFGFFKRAFNADLGKRVNPSNMWANLTKWENALHDSKVLRYQFKNDMTKKNGKWVVDPNGESGLEKLLKSRRLHRGDVIVMSYTNIKDPGKFMDPTSPYHNEGDCHIGIYLGESIVDYEKKLELKKKEGTKKKSENRWLASTSAGRHPGVNWGHSVPTSDGVQIGDISSKSGYEAVYLIPFNDVEPEEDEPDYAKLYVNKDYISSQESTILDKIGSTDPGEIDLSGCQFRVYTTRDGAKKGDVSKEAVAKDGKKHVLTTDKNGKSTSVEYEYPEKPGYKTYYVKEVKVPNLKDKNGEPVFKLNGTVYGVVIGKKAAIQEAGYLDHRAGKVIKDNTDEEHPKYYTMKKTMNMEALGGSNAEEHYSVAGATFAVIEARDLENYLHEGATVEDLEKSYDFMYSLYEEGESCNVITVDENGNPEDGPYEVKFNAGETSKDFWAIELNAPEGLELSKEVKKFTVTEANTEDNPAEFQFEDKIEKVDVKLKKTSKNDTISQLGQNNCYTLAGAVYGIYTSEDCTEDTKIGGNLVTDEDGNTNTVSLPAGDYYIKEITPSEGFKLCDEVHKVSATEPGETASVECQEVPSSDAVEIWGKKIDTETNKDREQGRDPRFENAQFEVKFYGIKDLADGQDPADHNYLPLRTWVFATDEKGEAKYSEKYKVSGDDLYYNLSGVPHIPLGVVTVEEIKSPEGYNLANNPRRVVNIKYDTVKMDFSSTATEETFKFIEQVYRTNLTIFKFEERPDFNHLDEANPLAGAEFTLYYKNGGDVVKDANGNPIKLVTNEHGMATTQGMQPGMGKVGDIYNRGALLHGEYILKETKTPEGFSPVKDVYVDLRNQDLQNHYWTYIVDDQYGSVLVEKKDKETGAVIPIKDTTFRILDEEGNIISMQEFYPQHKVITEFKTNENGYFQTPERLKLGTYYLEEIQAPHGYLKGEKLKFEINEAGNITEPAYVEYKDSPAKGKVRLTKKDSLTSEAVKGARYAIYAAEDIITEDRTVRAAKDSVVDVISTDENGFAESKELYLGKYYVKEVWAAPGYTVNPKEYSFELKYKDQVTPLVYENLDVTDDSTDLEIVKKDIDGKLLKGITFNIYNVNNVDEPIALNMEGNNINNFVTDKDGKINVKYLKKGSYAIKEVKTLPGYVLDKKIRYFNVDSLGHIYEVSTLGKPVEGANLESGKLSLEWVNDYTKVDISKTDVTGDNEVPGATLTVFDKDGKVVETWVSTTEPHRINKLPVGEYTLREEIAPNGYVVATDIKFIVDNTGKVQMVHMIDKQVFVSKTDVTGQKELPGAKLQVIDKETGKVVDSWTSTTEQHAVSGLKVGKTYILVEKIAPNGYVVANKIEFTVLDDNKIQKVHMVDKQVLVTKTDVTGQQELPGAKLTVVDKQTGKVVDSWTSGKKPHPVSGLQVGKTYILIEKTAPNGYVVASKIEFTVKDDHKIQKVHMIDKQVLVTKTDITGGKEISGAKLTVIDVSTGKVVDTWISSSKPHPVKGLEVGKTYILREEQAPDGYVIAEDIKFFVDDDARIQHIKMKDDHTKLDISKQDATTGKELPGAKLTLYDENGNVVKSWTSMDKPMRINRLKVGVYTLHEDLAPIGYNVASDVSFKLLDTGEVQTVIMKDEINSNLVQTGENLIFGLGILVIIAGCAWFVFRTVRRRKNNK